MKKHRIPASQALAAADSMQKLGFSAIAASVWMLRNRISLSNGNDAPTFNPAHRPQNIHVHKKNVIHCFSQFFNCSLPAQCHTQGLPLLHHPNTTEQSVTNYYLLLSQRYTLEQTAGEYFCMCCA